MVVEQARDEEFGDVLAVGRIGGGLEGDDGDDGVVHAGEEGLVQEGEEEEEGGAGFGEGG